MWKLLGLLALSALHATAAVPVDLSGVKPGPVSVESSSTALTVHWKDEAGRAWTAEFSLDPKSPLITAIAMNNEPVIARARTFFQCTTGKRRGGWDQFFDLPPSHPEGTHSYAGVFALHIGPRRHGWRSRRRLLRWLAHGHFLGKRPLSVLSRAAAWCSRPPS